MKTKIQSSALTDGGLVYAVHVFDSHSTCILDCIDQQGAIELQRAIDETAVCFQTIEN